MEKEYLHGLEAAAFLDGIKYAYHLGPAFPHWQLSFALCKRGGKGMMQVDLPRLFCRRKISHYGNSKRMGLNVPIR